MNEFLMKLCDALVPVLCMLITAGGAYLVALLRKRTAIMQQEYNNNLINKYVGMAVDAVDQAVSYVAQTFVDALKAEDAFTKERQLEAFNMAKNKVLEILGDKVTQCLNVIYADFEVWLETRIEQVCREIKQPETAAALPGIMLIGAPAGQEPEEAETDGEAVKDVELHPDVLRAMNDDTPPTSTPDEWPKPLPEETEAPEVEDPDADYEF